MKKEIKVDTAIELLPEKTKIHTFAFGGCDVEKERAEEIIRTSRLVYLDTEGIVRNHVIHCVDSGGMIPYESIYIEAIDTWKDIMDKEYIN